MKTRFLYCVCLMQASTCIQGDEMSEKKDTKSRILDAALEMFSEKGFKATTTRAIADKANVNEVTLFRYFGSKEKLFFEIVDNEANVRMNIINMKFEPSENMVGDLTMIGGYISKNMMERASFFKLLVMEVDRYPEIWEHIGTVPLAAISKLGQYFDMAKKKGLVRKDLDSEIMAVSFFSFLFRILVTNAFLGDDLFTKKNRDDGIREFAELFVNGVAKRSD
ncbi:MAG: TetR/AcrR family transcriptional regulator [Euryarchaeota archaeon]|nr:TetR/AcrR family transcriptional regulator [Euryarchaeota archaeon]